MMTSILGDLSPSSHPPKLLILYGSQTGQSRILAHRLYNQAKYVFNLPKSRDISPLSLNSPQCAINIRIHAMDEYLPVSRIANETGVVVFVCSTTGYGVPPDNMCHFWRSLMHRGLPVGKALSSRLKFAVLGLGDSSYSKFNVVSIKLYRRLCQLGASPLFVQSPSFPEDPGLGLADEQSELGIYGVLQWWAPQLWSAILEHYMLPVHPGLAESITLDQLESPAVIACSWPKYRVNSTRVLDFDEIMTSDTAYPSPKSQCFQVVENKRVTSQDHFQDTRLITFTPEIGMAQFQPGDCLFIQPQNLPDHVETLFCVTRACPSTTINLTIVDYNITLPCPSGRSARWYATHFFDLNAIPTSDFFANLATLVYLEMEKNKIHADDHQLDNSTNDRLLLEHARLLELGCTHTVVSTDDLNDYVTRPHRTVIEVLIDFPSTAEILTLDHWFDVLPGPMIARPYSITSAPGRIELLVAVVQFRTRMSTVRRGLASTYLASRLPGELISGWIHSGISGGLNFQGVFHNPPAPSLFVAPGTGIAPFRSVLWHQFNLNLAGRNLVIFGCRYSTKDFYFESEWRDLEEKGLLQLITAFSRESNSQNGMTNRVYVQHRIRENAHQVWSVLASPNSHVFIVGNAKTMPIEVRDALIDVCQREGQRSFEEAERTITQIELEGRMQVESWS